MQDREIDRLIESSLAARADGLVPPDDMFEKIVTRMDEGRAFMAQKKVPFVRFGAAKTVAAGLCGILLLAGTAYAASSISKYVQGFGTTKEYSALPSSAQIEKDAGFAAKIPDTLPGGFRLQDVSVATHMEGSDQGIVLDEARKAVGAMYGKEGQTPEAYVTLSASNDDTETRVADGALMVQFGARTARWWEYTRHVVPYGYQPSEEEIEQEKAGTLVTVYVSGKDGADPGPERFETVRSLKWQDAGISYVLTDTGCNLTLDEMLAMAEAVVDTK